MPTVKAVKIESVNTFGEITRLRLGAKEGVGQVVENDKDVVYIVVNQLPPGTHTLKITIPHE